MYPYQVGLNRRRSTIAGSCDACEIAVLQHMHLFIYTVPYTARRGLVHEEGRGGCWRSENEDDVCDCVPL